MAEHADAAQEELSMTEQAPTPPGASSPTDEDSTESPDLAEDYDAAVDGEVDGAAEDAAPVKKSMSPVRLATVSGLVIVVALGALTGWLGFRAYQSHQAQQQRALLVQVARQAALNLTTIDWQHADADIQRILDSATGTFYDDFSKRSKPFVDVVKKAQSKSVGTITESGLESQSGDEAQVLVAVSVNTSNLGAAEQEPRYWRMRISVQQTGDEVKVSNVAFVP